MRKLKLQVQMTVDGFIGGPNGELNWASFNWDKELNTYVGELTEPVDTILLGRKLAEGFIPYWASNPEGEAGRGAEKFNTHPQSRFYQDAGNDRLGQYRFSKRRPGGRS